MAYQGKFDDFIAQANELEQKKQAALKAAQNAAPHEKGLAEKIADWAPTAGGVLGGVVGSIIPGAGTVAGGVLGSMAGSGIKSLIKNNDADQTNNVNLQSGLIDAAKEGALGLVGEGAGRLVGLAAKPLLSKGAAVGAKLLAEKGAQTVAREGLDQAVARGAENVGSDVVSRNLAKIGNASRQAVINPKVPVGPSSYQAEEALAKKGMTILKGGTRNAMRKQSGEAMTAISGQIDEALKLNPNKINAGEVLDNMYSKIDSNPSVLGDKNAVNDAKEIIFQKLDSIANGKADLTAGEVHKFKQSLGEGAQRIFDKQAKNVPLTQAEEAYLSSWKSVDDSLTKIAPEVKDLTMRQSALYDLSPGLAQKGNVRLPGAGIQIPGSGAAIEKTLYGVGNAATALSKRAGTGLNAAGQAIVRGNDLMGGGASTMPQTGAGTETGANIDNPQTPEDYLALFNSQDQQQATGQGDGVGSNDIQGLAQMTANGGITKEMIGQLMLADLANGGKNIAALKTISDFVVPAEPASPKLTDGAIKTVNDYKSAMDNIAALGDTLKTTKVGVGPIAGRLNGLNPLNTDAQSLQSQIDVVRQTVGKALEGGVLRKEDEAKYQKILPTMADTAPVAQNKIKQLQTMLDRDYRRYIELQNSKGGGSFNLDGASIAQ